MHSEWENFKTSQSLCIRVSASFVLLCKDRYVFATTDSSHPFLSLKDTWSKDGLNDLTTLWRNTKHITLFMKILTVKEIE